jgi:nucleoside-diphosphate-sugar epimerase
VSPKSGGSKESDPPQPVGEYANSCLGRERVFQFYSERHSTRVLLFRLNYATDLRYGVLTDIAQRVVAGEPVDLSVNAANIIWQGDAINRALLCLEHAASPPAVLNVTGTETLRVEDIAREFASLLGRPARFRGEDSGLAYLSDASRSVELFGPPRIGAPLLVRWVADWVKRGGRTLGKPTHFSVTDGQFLDQ